MADVAIRVDNLSKQYRIGVLQQRHDTLRDQVTDVAKKLARPGKKEMNRPKTGYGPCGTFPSK